MVYMKETEMKTNNLKNIGFLILHWFEITLGIIILFAVTIVTINQIVEFLQADWSQVSVFMDALKIVLQIAIGIEVARLLFSYSLNTIIELAVFVVARKLLLIEGDFVSLLAGVVSLVILFAARHFFINDDKKYQE